jgi:hypothetical protein
MAPDITGKRIVWMRLGIARNQGESMTDWTEDLIRRFWSHVQKTDTCWLWIGWKNKGKWNYGRVLHQGRKYRAHRVAYELTYGPILPGLKILHHCDTPSCVRPDHLFVGTDGDNVRDAMRKNRRNQGFSKGENNPRARMTRAKVEEMRRLHASGISMASLARQFGILESNVWDIINHRTWKN